MLNKQMDVPSYQDIHNRNKEGGTMNNGVLKEDMHQKLLSLAD